MVCFSLSSNTAMIVFKRFSADFLSVLCREAYSDLKSRRYGNNLN